MPGLTLHLDFTAQLHLVTMPHKKNKKKLWAAEWGVQATIKEVKGMIVDVNGEVGRKGVGGGGGEWKQKR